jgi:hypothetical protein
MWIMLFFALASALTNKPIPKGGWAYPMNKNFAMGGKCFYLRPKNIGGDPFLARMQAYHGIAHGSTRIPYVVCCRSWKWFCDLPNFWWHILMPKIGDTNSQAGSLAPPEKICGGRDLVSSWPIIGVKGKMANSWSYREATLNNNIQKRRESILSQPLRRWWPMQSRFGLMLSRGDFALVYTPVDTTSTRGCVGGGAGNVISPVGDVTLDFVDVISASADVISQGSYIGHSYQCNIGSNRPM